MMKLKFKYIIGIENDKQTIGDFFKNFHFGKEKTNSLIYGDSVFLNDKKVTNNCIVLQAKDKLELRIEKCEMEYLQLELKILYEDDYILVVNKPSNILIHSDGTNKKTLINAVYNYLNKNRQNEFAFPVHRIDYETTGIVIFAKDPLMLSYLSVEIEKHNLIKEYVCKCYNKFFKKNGNISKKIGKNRHNNNQIITSTGKDAQTYFEVLENGDIAKVKIRILHGRKHQIRVHMSSIGHPLVGDKVYGKEDGERLKLHFKKVIFYHPFKREEVKIECEEDF